MFLQLLSCAFLFHLIMKEYYPKEYTSILIFLTEYGIFAYSFLELKAKKMYKQIKNNSSVNLLVEQVKSSNNVEIICKDKIVLTHLNKESIYSILPVENTFIVYSDPEPMTSRVNKLIVHNFSENTPTDVFTYKVCNYAFILTVVYLESRSLVINYDLKLFYNGDNYFVASNKIDKYVICYLLNKQKDVTCNAETCKYKLSIIDQNANMLDLSEKDVLYLHENNYEVVQVISETAVCEGGDDTSEENENSGSSVGSKEYEIVENENN